MSRIEHKSIAKDYPFQSRFLEINGHRLQYIEEGTGDHTVLFLHGNPEWSYYYRNVIPYLSQSARCIAVDNIGMGRSDKPDIGYTFLEHVDYISQFIEKLNLNQIVLVGHDWGVAIGLQYALHHPGKVKAVAMIEPQALKPCSWSEFSPPEAADLFKKLRDPEEGWEFMRDNSVFIEGLTQTIISRSITPEEHDFFREPAREIEKRKPMWVFPNQIPIEGQPAEVVEAVLVRNEWFTASSIPKLLIYAQPGCNVREPEIKWCQEHLPNLSLFDSGKGFHYLLEENPHGIGEELLRWYSEDVLG